jgi:hypothetical protein
VGWVCGVGVGGEVCGVGGCVGWVCGVSVGGVGGVVCGVGDVVVWGVWGVWDVGVWVGEGVPPCARTFQGLHSVRLWTPTIFIYLFMP